MSNPDKTHEQLLRDLGTTRLARIAEIYREVLDEAARKNTPFLQTFAALVAEEATARAERALQRRLRGARLPKPKLLAEYDFEFPKKVPKQKILRLFDCQFIDKHECCVFIGPTRTGKSHLLVALGYAACEKGRSVRYVRVVDMINTLTTAQINGTLQKALKEFVNPALLLLDELGYLPVDGHTPKVGRWSRPVVSSRRRPLRVRIDRVDHESAIPRLGQDLRRRQHPRHRHDRSLCASRGAVHYSRNQLSDERQYSRRRVTLPDPPCAGCKLPAQARF